MNESTKRIDQLADKPWLAEVSDIITLAERKGLTLTPSDVKGPSGDYVIDGMEWYEWVDAMTQDDDESSESEYSTTIGGLKISVDKDGGGTPGRSYPGTWTVTVMNGPEYVYDADTLHMEARKTHAQVARVAYEFASAQIDGGE